MRIHILGICGTFMGSLAILARALGHEVSGSDQNVYPPMSTQLEEQGIALCQGYDPAHIIASKPDIVVIGNTCSRGNAALEYVLEQGLPFTSGPAWLAEHVLRGRWVIGVAGTHGKTTTTSMVTWILDYAGMQPGYLIGGVPANFPVSARLGESDFFVIEADEYDSAFFDKRSKFIHYLSRTLILGNLEFDHADIFRDLEDIQRQFQHLVKTVPGSGLIITPADDANLETVLAKGLWCERQTVGSEQADWQLRPLTADGSRFEIVHQGQAWLVEWALLGQHNMANAIAAVAAAVHAGVPPALACEALGSFKGVKRRLELIGDCAGIQVYDDFAHHPTAIRSTLEGMRAAMQEDSGSGRLLVLIEARSNTMKMGCHQDSLAAAFDAADLVLWHRDPAAHLDLEAIGSAVKGGFQALDDTQAMIEQVLAVAQSGDRVVIMSNGGFDGIHGRLVQALAERCPESV